MRRPLCSLCLCGLYVVALPALAAQAPGTLRVVVTLLDGGARTPIARHALLVSDDPPSSAPRRIVSRADGTVDVALPPGTYVIESDQPAIVAGVAYAWTARVQIAAGQTAELALTQETAEVVPLPVALPVASPSNDPAGVHARWQDSVVAVWTKTTRASGVIADARGLVLTSQRAIGRVTSAEVQLTPSIKVAARVVVADVVRNVAVLRIDSAVAEGILPLAPECGSSAAAPASPLAEGQELVAIGVPLRGPKELSWGKVELQPRRVADLRMDVEEKGGPAFTQAGVFVGLTSATDNPSDPLGDAAIVGAADICETLKSAAAKFTGVPAPGATRLPVEPQKAFAEAAVEEASKRRVSEAIPYRMSAADFDISFITPVLVRAAERRWQQAGRRNLEGTARLPGEAQERVRLLTEFGHWSDYFEPFPPLLLIRVTPKLEESFWTRVARGAAGAKGVALPPMPRLGSGFGRLRVFCGSDEVTPVHPFRLVHQLNEQTTTHEGLYLFDAAALGPHCATVRLMVASGKDPEKFDSQTIDPKLVQLFWDDFALYRTPASQ